MNLEDMLKLFLNSRKRGVDGARKKCTSRTLELYEEAVALFIRHMNEMEEPVTRYENLRRMHIVQYLDWLDEFKKRNGERLSRATILHNLRCMKAFFCWVDKDEDCVVLGMRGLQRYLPAFEKTPRREFMPTIDELKKFRNAFDTDTRSGYRNHLVTSLILNNGMRISELCHLKLDHLKLDDGIIIVPEEGKTGTRIVPVTQDVSRLLRGWFRRRERYSHAADSPYVFIGYRGDHMKYKAFDEAFASHRRRHNLAPITPHTLRHVFCTLYLKNGGEIEKLRSITGHTNFTMLLNYLHTAQAAGSEAYKELERVNPLRGL